MPTASAVRAGRAFVEVFADNTRLVRGLRQAEGRVRAFARRVQGAGLRLAGLGAAMVGPVVAAAKAFSSMGDRVAKVARRTGFSVEALSELRFAASQSGTSLEDLETALRRMQRSIYDAGRGLSTQTDALRDLGLTYADLAGLRPEEQFELLAERISRVSDATRRAALAMVVFGRRGTMLLPMFARGAEGIRALRAEARRLGLTMSREDTRAAEDLTDALDAAWKAVRMGAFHVGAALAPVVERFARSVAVASSRVGAFVREHRALVVLAVKAAAGLVVLGGALAVVGAALRAAAAGLTAARVAAVALGRVLALVASPVGVVAAALGAVGVAVAHATGATGKALAWMSRRFGFLAEDVRAAWRGMREALARGDLGLAARIALALVRLEVARFVGWVRLRWLDVSAWWVETWEGMRAAAAVVWHNLRVAWIEVCAFLRRQWVATVYALQRPLRNFAGAVRFWADVVSKGWSEAVERARRRVVEEAREDPLVRRLVEEAGRVEEERRRARERETRRHEAALVAAVEESARRRRRIREEQAREERRLAAAVVEARRKLAETVRGEARGAEEERRRAEPAAPEVSGAEFVRRAAQVVVRGTFFGTLAGRVLGGEYTAQRIAAATERTARNTDELVRRRGELVFS